MATKRKPIIPPVSIEEAQKYVKIINERSTDFVGQLDELETAIGMMMIGRLFGWKVLALIHSKRTVRKYEDILGIEIQKMFDPEGPLSSKSNGYAFVRNLGNFWKAVSGEVKIEGRREVK